MSHSHKSTRLLSRRHILCGGVSLGAAAAFGNAIWAQSPQLTAEIARAAQAWLATLSDTERAEAQRGWSDAREDWHYIPRSRPGLTLGDMDDKQSAAAWDLFGTLMSTNGIERLRGAVKVERVLGELTGNLRFRDPGNYALVIFGDPNKRRSRGVGASKAITSR